jgi:hypothetical protein
MVDTTPPNNGDLPEKIRRHKLNLHLCLEAFFAHLVTKLFRRH